MEKQDYFVIRPNTLERVEGKIDRLANMLESREDNRKLWLTRKEFMDICSIGTTKFYELMNAGLLETRKINRKLYVHKDSIESYFNQ